METTTTGMNMGETEPRRVGGQTSGRGDFARGVNLGDTERMASAVAGGALLLYGVARGGRGALGGWALAGLGAALAYRGLTGFCHLYGALGIDRSARAGTGEVKGNLGIKLEAAVMVQASPDRVYRVWRRFSNLPRFLSHVERVEELDSRRSRWTIRVPAGMSLTWDAESINDVPGEVIAWRTVDTRLIEHAGSVKFEPAFEGRSTIVRVSMQYAPPAGELGHQLAKALGQDPNTQIEQDLANFKRAMEAGELAA